MKIKIFLNKTYKNTCNLISIDIKCHYFKILNNNLLIDNIGVCNLDIINSIEFIVNGYKNTIEFENKKIFTSELIYTNILEINDIYCIDEKIKTLFEK